MVAGRSDDPDPVRDSGTGDPESSDSSGDELLHRWESQIEEVGDPLVALADLLGERQAMRGLLFSRVGAVVLGCKLQRILGAGGMGVTYSGMDPAGVHVAVKLIPRVEGLALERFEQECRVLRALDHPRIVRYRDHAVTGDGVGVLVMDLVTGVDLERVFDGLSFAGGVTNNAVVACLRQGIESSQDVPWRSPRLRRRLLRILADVADGLHAAHARGVVHRDVKPTNILVRDDLSAVLIDFGLARDVLNRVSFTQSGIAMGTLAYMAPEQLGRDPGAVDRRTDIFALGLVLYRALCGEELRERVGDVVRSSRPFLLNPRHSRSLSLDQQAILYRCLDPRPARRYQTAADLAADLRAAAGNGAVSATRPSALALFARDRRRLGFAVLLACVLLLALAWRQWPRGRQVMFVATCEPAAARLLVEGLTSVSPGGQAWLPYGEHRVRLIGSGLREVTADFEVVPGPGAQWVALRTLAEGGAPSDLLAPRHCTVQWQTGHGWVEMAPGVPRDQRWIDGTRLDGPAPFLPELLLPVGSHEFRAVDGKGREERQVLQIGEAPEDVQLLPAVMADIDGEFRLTWSTVLSARPAAIELAGEYETWLGPLRPSALDFVHAHEARCALTVGGPGADGLVELVCRLPRPMRSAVVHMRMASLPGSSLEVAAGFVGEEARPWPRGLDGQLQQRAAFLSPLGADALRITVHMRVQEAPTPSLARVRCFDGMLFGGHWRDEPPCFAVVADPDDAARLPPEIEVPMPARQARIGRQLRYERLSQRGAGRLHELQVLEGPDGARDLAVCVLHEDGLGLLQRWSWPDLELRRTWTAEDLHPRRAGQDGKTFGEDLAAVPDQDGDGWQEVVVGDQSSELRGGTMAGVIGLLRSTDGATRWLWPRTPPTAEYGDDKLGSVLAVGDWDGVGRTGLIVSAQNASSAAGAKDRVGVVECIDPATLAPRWRLHGARIGGRLQLLDARNGGSVAPPTLLLAEERAAAAAPGRQVTEYGLWVGGAAGRRVVGVPHSRHTAALLVGPAGGGAAAMLTLTLGRWQSMEPGLRRFVERDGTLSLAAEQALLVEGFDDIGLPGEIRLWGCRTGDIDDDGESDAAFGLGGTLGNGVLFVSGKTLKLLGWVPMEGRLTSAQGHWMPAVSNSPAQLLVVQERGEGEARVSELVGIVPR